MIEETSAGGVVIFGNALLLLKKFNGDWVLPKGRQEANETLEETALREVFEEAGVRAKIDEYIGEANYGYKNYIKNRFVKKTVHWYLMSSNTMDSTPQKDEGFIDAVYVHIDRAASLVKYNDERKIIEQGLDIFKDR